MSGNKWQGEYDEEMDKLFEEYHKKFNTYPDDYIEVFPNVFPYDIYMKLIRYAIDENIEIESIFKR